MSKKQTLRVLALAMVLTPLSTIMGYPAVAQQHETSINKDIYWISSRSDLVAKARKKLQAGKLQQARKYYLKSLKSTMRKRDKITAFNDLCVLYNMDEQYEKALGYCNKALKLSPKNWRGFNNRGIAYLGFGKYELARQDFAKALSLNPGDSRLALNQQLASNQQSAVNHQLVQSGSRAR